VRRLRRILINALAGLSLLLCMAAVGLWVRSSWYFADRVSWVRAGGVPVLNVVELDRGRIVVFRAVPVDDSGQIVGAETEWLTEDWRPHADWDVVPAGTGVMLSYVAFDEGTWRWGGLVYQRERSISLHQAIRFRVLAVPLWMIGAASAVLPCVRAIDFVRRRRRYAQGHCPACGYDLRATPDRCPECGREANDQS
jgi:hypothetical protein